MYHSVFNLGHRAFSLPTAMEKAQGTRLIVCCLEELSLRPFYTFFCLLSNAFPDFGSVGRLVEKEKTPKKKKWKRSLELEGLVPRHNNMRSLSPVPELSFLPAPYRG